MSLNDILRKCTEGYKFTHSQEKINHLMLIYNIMLFVKNEKELETLIQTIRYRNGIRHRKRCHSYNEN